MYRAEQVDAVVAIGCDSLQGYLFSAPLGPSELRHWIDQRVDRRASEATVGSARPIASGR